MDLESFVFNRGLFLESIAHLCTRGRLDSGASCTLEFSKTPRCCCYGRTKVIQSNFIKKKRMYNIILQKIQFSKRVHKLVFFSQKTKTYFFAFESTIRSVGSFEVFIEFRTFFKHDVQSCHRSPRLSGPCGTVTKITFTSPFKKKET